jgi:multicomponent Na+:H+ antiporter subunit D
MSGASLVVLAVAAPLLGAALIPLFHGRPNPRETVTLATSVVLLGIVLTVLAGVLDGDFPRAALIEVLPGLPIAFAVEPLGMLFATIASSLWIVNSVYSIGYMRGNNEPRQTSYYTAFAVAISAAIGVAFAANLFTLFIFYEALTLSTYPLVTHKATDEAKAAGRVYLLLLLGTSMVLFLPAIIWTWYLAGTTDFTPGGILEGTASPALIGVLLALYAFGIGKAALMPFHFWLPAAMVAPTPVSALLHAVAVVKAGVFTITKVVVYVFGLETLAAAGTADWLVWIAGFTIIAASIVALRQDNLKRRLAYSTVSQLSYVILGVAILAPISVIGAVLHIASHAVSKITLFFAAGSVYTAAHVTEISQMRGIGRRMPWTMTAFAIGALSMIGVPPTAGFLGKWFMLTGAMQTGQWIAVTIIAVSTVLNAGYYLPIVVTAFLRAPAAAVGAAGAGPAHDHGEAPWPIVTALTATAIGTVLLFLFPGAAYELASMMMAAALEPASGGTGG